MSSNASAAEKGIFQAINKFRENPEYIRPFITRFKNGIERLNLKDPTIILYKQFLQGLHMIQPTEPLRYSEELSQAAHEYLEKCKDKQPDKNILCDAENRGVFPNNFMDNDPLNLTVYHNNYDSPDLTVSRLLVDTEDPEHKGQIYLTDDQVTQVGIAVDEGEADGENSHCVIMLGEDERFEGDDECELDEKYEKMKKPTELRLAFEALSDKKTNRINIKDVLQQVEEEHTEERYPTLVNMLKELGKTGKDEIFWPEFAQHFHSRMSDNTKDKNRREIFEIFKVNPEVESIDKSELDAINTYLKKNKIYTGMNDEQVGNMLKMQTYNKFGVSYDDYIEKLERKKNENQEEDDN